MTRSLLRWSGGVFGRPGSWFALTVALWFAISLAATATTGFAQDAVRLVLKGHDPVAYFTEGKAVKGVPEFSHDWDGGRYHFASARHRDMFAADPERYAPQFGGYCTGAMSNNVRNEGDPEGWVIQGGKLYVFGMARFKPIAEADPKFIESRAERAAKHWREQRQKGGS